MNTLLPNVSFENETMSASSRVIEVIVLIML